MEKEIIFVVFIILGLSCIIFPKNIAKILSLFMYADNKSRARPFIIRLMGLTLIIIILSMYYA